MWAYRQRGAAARRERHTLLDGGKQGRASGKGIVCQVKAGRCATAIAPRPASPRPASPRPASPERASPRRARPQPSYDYFKGKRSIKIGARDWRKRSNQGIEPRDRTKGSNQGIEANDKCEKSARKIGSQIAGRRRHAKPRLYL